MSEHLIDALPYFDNDLQTHPDIAAAVDAEIARELKAQPPPNPDADPRLPPSFEPFAANSFLTAELDRVRSTNENQTSNGLDTTRYKLPEPNPSLSQDENAWKKALENAKSQLEHQKNRQMNLGLLQTYGANAWRVHNYLVEATAKQLETELHQLQDQVTEVNRDRKNSQTLAGNQLTSLETRWTELISNVLQIELANAALEGEIADLEKQAIGLGA